MQQISMILCRPRLIVKHNSCRALSLRKICIRGLVGICSALKVFSIYQSFDLLLDHIDIRLESGCQLLESFGHELLMREILPLSAALTSASTKPAGKLPETHFMIRTMAASIATPLSSSVLFCVSLLSSLLSTLLELPVTTPILTFTKLLVKSSLK